YGSRKLPYLLVRFGWGHRDCLRHCNFPSAQSEEPGKILITRRVEPFVPSGEFLQKDNIITFSLDTCYCQSFIRRPPPWLCWLNCALASFFGSDTNSFVNG